MGSHGFRELFVEGGDMGKSWTSFGGTTFRGGVDEIECFEASFVFDDSWAAPQQGEGCKF